MFHVVWVELSFFYIHILESEVSCFHLWFYIHPEQCPSGEEVKSALVDVHFSLLPQGVNDSLEHARELSELLSGRPVIVGDAQ